MDTLDTKSSIIKDAFEASIFVNNTQIGNWYIRNNYLYLSISHIKKDITFKIENVSLPFIESDETLFKLFKCENRIHLKN